MSPTQLLHCPPPVVCYLLEEEEGHSRTPPLKRMSLISVAFHWIVLGICSKNGERSAGTLACPFSAGTCAPLNVSAGKPYFTSRQRRPWESPLRVLGELRITMQSITRWAKSISRLYVGEGLVMLFLPRPAKRDKRGALLWTTAWLLVLFVIIIVSVSRTHK